MDTLANLLPTIGNVGGSIIGGVLGGLGGVAGGAAVPGADLTGAPEVAGGVMGERLGQTAGGGIGQGAGKWLQDLITGKPQDAGNIASNVGIGAASTLGGNLIGGIAGKALNGIGQKATDFLGSQAAGRTAATEASQLAATQAAREAPYKAIEGTLASQKAQLGPTLASMENYGLSIDPKVLAPTTDKLTSVMTDIINRAHEASPNPVDITGSVSLANNIANSPELATAGSTVGPAFQKAINSVLHLNQGGGATLTNNAPSDIYQARQFLMQQAFKPGQNPALANAYHDMATSLDGALKSSGVDSQLAGAMTPEEYQALHAISPQIAQDASGAISQGVGAAKSFQKPFVDANHLADNATAVSNSKLDSTVAVNEAKQIAQNTPAAPSKFPLLDTASIIGAPFTGGATLLGLLPHALSIAKNPQVQDAVLSGVSRDTATGRTANDIAPLLAKIGSVVGGAAGGLSQSDAAKGVVPTSNQPNQVLQGGASVNPINPIDQTYQQQLAEQQQLMLEQSQAPLALSGGLSGAISGLGGNLTHLAPLVQQQKMAASALGQLPGAYSQASPGILGAMAGALPWTSEAAYNQQANTEAATLAKLLNISPQEAAGLVPQLMQGQGAGTQRLQGLQSILSSLGQG